MPSLRVSDLLCLWLMNACSAWGTWCAREWTNLWGIIKVYALVGLPCISIYCSFLCLFPLHDVRADTFHQCLQHHQQLEWSCMYFSGSWVPHISILFSLTLSHSYRNYRKRYTRETFGLGCLNRDRSLPVDCTKNLYNLYCHRHS